MPDASFVAASTSRSRAPTARTRRLTRAPLLLARADRPRLGLDKLNAAGIDGGGTTIAVVIPFGSPTIAADLHAFDQTFGTPGTPGITPYPPIGHRPAAHDQAARQGPAYDPTTTTRSPGRRRRRSTSSGPRRRAGRRRSSSSRPPSTRPRASKGFPEIEAAEKYIVDHGLADIIVQTSAPPSRRSRARGRSSGSATGSSTPRGTT